MSRRLGVGGVVIAAALAWSLAASAGAAGCDQWTGATSESWTTASNWTAGVPKSNTTVCISGTAQHPSVTVAGHAVAGTVSLGAHATLTIASEATLTVSHSAQVAGSLSLVASSSVVSAPSLSLAHEANLSGVGAVHGNVDNAGTVSVLDGASGVPLRISGEYRQRGSGSILFREEGGSFTQLRAGSASLDGRLDLLILDALVPGSKYVGQDLHPLVPGLPLRRVGARLYLARPPQGDRAVADDGNEHRPARPARLCRHRQVMRYRRRGSLVVP